MLPIVYDRALSTYQLRSKGLFINQTWNLRTFTLVAFDNILSCSLHSQFV